MENKEEAGKYSVNNDSSITGQTIGDQNIVNIYYSQVATPERLWTVPFARNRFFIGQEELLASLHQNLYHGTATAMAQIQAISGLGGIGKTQLVVEYAYRYSGVYPYVFWVRAEHRETLISDFVNLARLLQLPQAQEVEQMRIVTAIMQWLATHQNWLLIFDNVEDLGLLTEFVPTHRLGAIILTTKLAQTQPLAAPLVVNALDERLGAELLLQRASILSPGQVLERASAPDQQAARQIAHLVGGLPLALDQAGAYIEETQCQVQDYLTFYQQDQQIRYHLLQRRGKGNVLHSQAVTTTWKLSFVQIEQTSSAAADLLRACAFLDPDLIPEELLRQSASFWSAELAQVAGSNFQWNETIGALLKYSLVRRSREQQALSIHRLVQMVLKDELDKSVTRQWAERTIQAVASAFPDSRNPANWDSCKRLLPHALRCIELIVQENLLSLKAAGLLMNVAEYLEEHAQYQEAEPLYQQALSIRKQQLGSQHLDVAYTLQGLAILYSKQGKYAQAEPLYQRTLSIQEQVLGPQHPAIAEVQGNLANLYSKQGKHIQAEQFYLHALSIQEQQLGPDDLAVATSLNNLASLYAEQGNYTQAEPLYQRALAIRERQLRPDDPALASSLDYLASLYAEQGNYTQAEPLYQRALFIWEQRLGPEHPNVASLLVDLAGLYAKQGKYDQAEPPYQRALSIQEQRLGPEHPDIALSLYNLALLYAKQGKYDQAEPLYQRALFIWEQRLGPEHPNVASLLVDLAGLYAKQGKYDQAEPLYQRALSIQEQRLGPEHPEVASLLDRLAHLYAQQNKYTQAEPLYQRALFIWAHCEVIPSRNDLMDRISSCIGLAEIHAQQGKYASAESLYQRALSIWEPESGPRDFLLIALLNELMNLYAKQGKHTQARLLYQRIVRLQGQQ